MPRYFFDVVNGHRLADPAGLDCRSADEAQRQGQVIAAQIAQEVPMSVAKRHVVIRDENGQEIATILVG